MASISDSSRPPRWRLATEAVSLIARAYRAVGRLGERGPADGEKLMVIPGFLADDRTTLGLQRALARAGYRVTGWGLGLNKGVRADTLHKIVDRVERFGGGRPVILVGWSLGGIYARQLAKMLPDEVRGVITLGSPFNGDPRATNAWKLYEFTSGHKVDDRERHMGGAISDSPPVPTTAIYSRSDGICAWQNCVENDLPHTESIEVEASHCGLGHHPAVVYAVADRLAQPEGQWKKFDRSGFKALFYPDPKR